MWLQCSELLTWEDKNVDHWLFCRWHCLIFCFTASFFEPKQNSFSSKICLSSWHIFCFDRCHANCYEFGHMRGCGNKEDICTQSTHGSVAIPVQNQRTHCICVFSWESLQSIGHALMNLMDETATVIYSQWSWMKLIWTARYVIFLRHRLRTW